MTEILDGAEVVLKAIAARRDCLGECGIPDLNRVSEILIRKYHWGKLGCSLMERPSDIHRSDD